MRIAIGLLVSGLLLGLLLRSFERDPRTAAAESEESKRFCSATSRLAVEACQLEARADYLIARGRCLGISDPDERGECLGEAREAFEDARSSCREQRKLRKDLCKELGEDIYDPQIDPEGFVERVDNPLLPFKPGSRWVYRKESDEGTETTEVLVTADKREILGVECTVVRDTVKLDGELVEDTLDFYAQDAEGNVWYFGERSFSYEQGEISSLGGSWQAGVDGARPGIVMKAAPRPGELYRQEYFLGEAEDMARVLRTNEAVTVPYGKLTGCLETEEITPLEPDAHEHKFYAPGVGLLLELDVDTGARTELLEASGL